MMIFRLSRLVGYVKKKLRWTPKILVEAGTSSSSRPIIFRVYAWRLSSPPKEIPKLYGIGPYTISLFACKIVIYSWRSLFFKFSFQHFDFENFPTDSNPRLSVQTVYERIQVLFWGLISGPGGFAPTSGYVGSWSLLDVVVTRGLLVQSLVPRSWGAKHLIGDVVVGFWCCRKWEKDVTGLVSPTKWSPIDFVLRGYFFVKMLDECDFPFDLGGEFCVNSCLI